MVWRAEDPQGFESDKIKWEIVPYTRGAVLDLGCGPRKTFPHFVGVDNCKDTELFNIDINPDYRVETCENLSDFETEACDGVFSSHLLEHIEDYKAALKEWWRVIKVGGNLTLYLPHKKFYPNIGTPGANSDHKHDFEPLDIINALRDIAPHFDILERQERNEDNEYSFLLVVQKRASGGVVSSYLTRKAPKKTACVVRYGGFGDMLQAANILPELKRQGYHVTVMTTPKGRGIIEHDPHVDAWQIQDTDQVPNHLLPDFWQYWSKKYDKFINLSESVEGTLLPMPGRASYLWPSAVRDKYLNTNYLEFTSELAEIPYRSESRFYPSEEERDEAYGRLLHGGFNMLFALAGSSLHKFYPYQDTVIARVLLEKPDCRIFLVGDVACKILETGWEKENRVIKLSGEINIRQTLALAQVCDAVVGPETGVLNAVAFEPNRKVCLLSHSSVENLTKHWVNTASVTPECGCYPCHRLHYTWSHCQMDEQVYAAECQASIHPDRVFNALTGDSK